MYKIVPYIFEKGDDIDRYIFKNLKELELSIKAMQSKLTSMASLSWITSAIFLILLNLNRAEQNKKISELEKKIKELEGA